MSSLSKLFFFDLSDSVIVEFPFLVLFLSCVLSSLGLLCLCVFVLMDDQFTAREYGWIESSGSEVSSDPFADKTESDFQSNEGDEIPFARHGPIIEANPEEVNMQRDFWSFCAIGFILDYRKFSIPHLQHIINVAWRIRGSITVVGRDSNFYLLHFELMEDLNHICNEGPWEVDGAFFALEKWRPNLVLNRL